MAEEKDLGAVGQTGEAQDEERSTAAGKPQDLTRPLEILLAVAFVPLAAFGLILGVMGELPDGIQKLGYITLGFPPRRAGLLSMAGSLALLWAIGSYVMALNDLHYRDAEDRRPGARSVILTGVLALVGGLWLAVWAAYLKPYDSGYQTAGIAATVVANAGKFIIAIGTYLFLRKVSPLTESSTLLPEARPDATAPELTRRPEDKTD
jgi:hypothetical protein